MVAIGADPAVALVQEVAQRAGGVVLGGVGVIGHGQLEQRHNVGDAHRGVVVLVIDHGLKEVVGLCFVN